MNLTWNIKVELWTEISRLELPWEQTWDNPLAGTAPVWRLHPRKGSPQVQQQQHGNIGRSHRQEQPRYRAQAPASRRKYFRIKKAEKYFSSFTCINRWVSLIILLGSPAMVRAGDCWLVALYHQLSRSPLLYLTFLKETGWFSDDKSWRHSQT